VSAPIAGLAALNFFLADVQGGLGPFLATWLAAIDWNPEQIGVVMTAGALVGLAFNSPAGVLIDRTRRYRLWLALSSSAIVVGTLAMLPARGFVAVTAAQVVAALGGALMAPAVMALTLGIVGKERFPRQQGSNQAWNHAGNVVAAVLVAGATFVVGATAAFWVLAGMAAASLGTLLVIPADAVDTQRASGHAASKPAASFMQILRDRRILGLSLALLLFHLGNAAMLPLLGQRMAAAGHGDATRWLAACVVVAQLVMVPVAIVAGRMADRINPAWLMVAACLVLPVRGAMAALAQDPMWLIPIQVLDALGAGTLGVAMPILVADFTWGSGRTQAALGVASTMQGIGAALSTTLGGVLAARIGWTAAFLGLSVPAVFALALSVRLLGSVQDDSKDKVRGALLP
jgi:MFS family permease